MPEANIYTTYGFVTGLLSALYMQKIALSSSEIKAIFYV